MLGMAVLGVGRMGMVHARNVATVQAIAAETGAPVRDIDAVIADPAIEAVLIATPTDTHADLVESAAVAGKALPRKACPWSKPGISDFRTTSSDQNNLNPVLRSHAESKDRLLWWSRASRIANSATVCAAFRASYATRALNAGL
jgi:hypothetical protein